ncbi:hypothetical protein [Algoriphagus halophytocola]|uniref:PE-PGRS family protein n=1 Tax=Algoriphagus halophytocola TaxID=2991499 RepID=A0ABY6MKN6_9BACT|nr:hypothetical protein [Algoriphagus sp. TR-M5]UZD24338.1 hypothetical protein OM944_07510 [Algoriphagus sp. TR-M5]
MKFGLLLLVTLQFSIWAFAQDTSFQAPMALREIQDQTLEEISGLAQSRIDTDRIYVHNDSGGEPIIYVLSLEKELIAELVLEGAENIDWEDIAVGPGPGEESYIYVGDIGDNRAVRDQVVVYRVMEPETLLKTQTVSMEKVVLTYPKGPRDAETLMVDPISKDVFIVSKRDKTNNVFRLKFEDFPKGKVELENVAKLDFGGSVGGDISPDGTKILIKTYLEVYYWKREEGQSIAETLESEARLLPYDPEPQGEAIGFDSRKPGYFTLSERRFNIIPVLYRYPLTD